jgi:hypothetical protein
MYGISDKLPLFFTSDNVKYLRIAAFCNDFLKQLEAKRIKHGPKERA